MKIKFFLISLSVLILIILLSIKVNFLNLNEYFFNKLPIKSKFILKNIKKNNSSGHKFSHIFNNFFNDYNVKFLPETQLINLNYEKKKIIFDKSFQLTNGEIEYITKRSDAEMTHFFSFYIEEYQNYLILSDYTGNFYILDSSELKSNKKKLTPLKIDSNLNSEKILDTFVYKDELFVSFSNSSNKCYNWNISKTKINKKRLNFKKIYSSEECSRQNYYQPHGGRMQQYKHNGTEGLLFTVGENASVPQNKDSIIGKILFIPFDTFQILEFSKGHRNTQGLFVYNETILSTEHGPRGGDEINKIEFEKNYGWPKASYGEPYGPKNDKPIFFKEHKKYGFKEPLFVFSKAIGISELIHVPNNFSSFWIDNFIISSLWGQSIYRMKFDENFEKTIFFEKIFIGQRIRDMKYHNKLNAVLLALEEKGEIGIITNN
jgi:glucose/arabinose dehydrogenase